MHKKSESFMVNFKRSIKAISPVISTLLMIAIAVVASLVAYAWVMGYIGGTTTKTGNSILIPNTSHTGGTSDYLVIYVQNVGQGMVHVKQDGSVYVNDVLQNIRESPQGTALTSGQLVPISPGETATLVINYLYTPGEKLRIKVVTTEGTTMEIADSGAISGSPTSGTFGPHTITASSEQPTQGQITPSGAVIVQHGGSQTFTISFVSGYHVSDVKVDGTSVGAVLSYTFTDVDANHAIVASFAANPSGSHYITATYGANGLISPSGQVSVANGANQVFDIQPNTGYHTSSLTVDGGSVTPQSTYTFSGVTADHTIRAEFAADSIITHTITVTQSANGQITPATGQVTHGTDKTYTITGNSGFYVVNVVVDGGSLGSLSSYTFTNVIQDHTISATFAAIPSGNRIIHASSGTHGQISPVGDVSVANGNNQAFTFTPESHYHIADVQVDSVSVGTPASYTFTGVTADHTIAVSFAIDSVTITASAGTNGQIAPSGSVQVTYGADQAFTITANTGFSVSDVLVDGTSVGSRTSYTFTGVTASHTISASFSAIPTGNNVIHASAGAHGQISPAGDVVVLNGNNQLFTITPDLHYHVSDVLVDGLSIGAQTAYTFTTVITEHTIVASFAIDTVTITASTADSNGLIAPSGTIIVNSGADQTFLITPNSGYNVANVLVDGVSVGPQLSYTFTAVSTDHTIVASFSVAHARLVFTTGLSQTLSTNTLSTVITVQRRDQNDIPTTSGSLTVQLTSTATTTGRFYNENGQQITSVTIQSGSNYGTFYYRDSAAGSPTLTASVTSGTYTSAMTQFTIFSGSKAVCNIASSISPANSITPGSQIRDTAKLVGQTATAGGTFTYSLYRGTYQTGTPTLIGSDTVTVTNGVVPNSKLFTVPQSDSYFFLTQYSGDANNDPVGNNIPEEFVAWPLSQTILLRPNADTTDRDLQTTGATSGYHYTCVDDVAQDGAATYVSTASGHDNFWTDDVYEFQNPAHTGTVAYITINGVARTTVSSGGYMQLAMTTHGQEFDGSANPGIGNPLTSSWLEYTAVWKTNPYTGVAWTWAEIDALQIGVSLYCATTGGAQCTQVYIQIYYTP
jgi:flagellin-like protein